MPKSPNRTLQLCTLALGLSAATALAQPPQSLQAVSAQAAPSALPDGWWHGAFMEIFVRAYQDSDGDGIGDLRGLTQRLDYLHDLGVKGLWLMPITASADHDHGYAVSDFRAVEPAYGSLADLQTLLREAHARGIGVIIDYVLNHSAAAHPIFQASATQGDGPWRDWYVWREATQQADLKAWDIWGQNPWYRYSDQDDARYFATFGAAMPDFNLRNPEVVAFHEQSLQHWLALGVDGFRLDAVPHLIENNARDWNDQPESRALTARFVRGIRKAAGRHVVCEATAAPLDYADPALCGSAFVFEQSARLLQAAKGDHAAIKALAAFWRKAPPGVATMLSNHDIFAGQRAWDQFGGDGAAYRLAAASYLLGPGTPFIYYGEEIGQAGVAGLPGDEPLRAPMSWAAPGDQPGFSSATPFRPMAPNAGTHNVALAEADPNSLLQHYRSLLRLRNALPELASGRSEGVWSAGQLLGLTRVLGERRSLLLFNYGQQGLRRELRGLPPGSRWTSRHPEQGQVLRADSRGRLRLPLPAQSVQVWELQANRR